MRLEESLFENIPEEKTKYIEDVLMEIDGTEKVEFDYDAELPEQIIIIPKHFDEFGNGVDYLKNHITWKKSIIKAIKELGLHIDDPVEDNDPYMYIVASKKSITEAISEDKSKEFETKLLDTLSKEVGYEKSDKLDNFYTYTLWSDYNDRLEDYSIKRIMDADDPEEYFYEYISDAYLDSEIDEKGRIESLFIDEISEEDKEDAEEWFADYSTEYFDIEPDFDNFLSQEVKAILMIDNGDANYDFSNIDYTLDYGESGIADTTGLAWLIKQQGHTVDEVIDNWRMSANSDNKFVNSVAEELRNVMSSMNAIVFLGKATLKDVFGYKKAEGIRVKKGAMCGLFDRWYGSGSTLDIILEKDVEVPQKNIYYFGPDISRVGWYSVDDVYGMSSQAYKPNVFETYGKNESLKEDLTKYSSGMKVKIKGDDSDNVYVITDISKEDGVDIYNLVNTKNLDGEAEDEVYEFNELELVDRDIKEGYCLMERGWVKSVPNDIATEFYAQLHSDSDDLHGIADVIERILQWLEAECQIDDSDTDDIRDEIAVINLDDRYDFFDEEEETTNEEQFDEVVINGLYDLLDLNSIWMPTEGELSK